jgi:DNA-binding NtrC family response regulator
MSDNNQYTILIADDDPDLLEQLKIRLEFQGYKILLASSHNEAIQIIEEKHFDLAIFDLVMEFQDSGFILSYKLKHKYPERPVIILSSMVHELNVQSQLSLQPDKAWLKANAVIQKGVRFEILHSEIERLLASQKNK